MKKEGVLPSFVASIKLKMKKIRTSEATPQRYINNIYLQA